MFATACGACMIHCVFQKEEMASVHEVIKGIVSTTPLFNGFFTNMDQFFGYGRLELAPEDWWNDMNQPISGLTPGRESSYGL